MNKILSIFLPAVFSFSVLFAQQNQIIRQVKKSDLELHGTNLITLLSFLDSTRDYSAYEILSFDLPMNVNGAVVVSTQSGSNCTFIQAAKPGALVHIEKIKYVPRGQAGPVKVFPDLRFKVIK